MIVLLGRFQSFTLLRKADNFECILIVSVFMLQ